jgi:4-amino-4-deoxychorismate lyase
MCQFLETIKCKDGELFNLRFHQNRFNLARRDYFGITREINLEEMIKIPEEYKTGLFRCRVIYSKAIEKIEFFPHYYRKVQSLKSIENNQIDYRYKFANRQYLEKLFARRGNCDDILIVKNGCITDSFTANVIFYNGQSWWTPDTPLLPGIQRAKLLDEGKISVCRITYDDLHKYQKVGLINAMQNLEKMPVIEISKVQ